MSELVKRWLSAHWWDLAGIGSIFGAFAMFCHWKNLAPIEWLSRLLASVNWFELGFLALFVFLAFVGFFYFVAKVAEW